jgi:xanthine dehydrogenase YagR molybdenum-binding subunit
MSEAAPAPKDNMGQPEPRIDGRLKVTGGARYAADFPLRNPVYAYLLLSSIAKGRISSFDLTAAKSVSGFIDVITHENAPKLKEVKFFNDGGYASTRIQPLASSEIFHEGQIIGLVLADSFEAAREAAYKIKVDYNIATPSATFDSPGTKLEEAADVSKRHEDSKVGDADKAFAIAPIKVDEGYETPTQHHNAIELFATSALWEGEKLTIYEPSQFVNGLKHGVAEALGIDAKNVRVLSPFIGGAFGSKASMTPRTALVAAAAHKLNRPVKLVVPRDQGFTIATYRAETRHRVQIACGTDGKFSALNHQGFEITSRTDAYLVGGTETTTRLYACPDVGSKVFVVRADRNTPGFMRSPPEVPYVYALETAIDELAVKLKMDPVELRRVNDTMNEPIKGNPYTSRSLMQCYDEAAAAFGWNERDVAPGSMIDGDWMVGYGCATACYPTGMDATASRVTLSRDGRVRVEMAVHDIGTGAYTVIAQTAAEKLEVPLQNVEVILGDSDLPPGPVAGGSVTTASACSAVIKACDQIRDRLSKAVIGAKPVPLKERAKATVGLADQPLPNAGAPMPPLEEAFDRLGAEMIEEYAEWKPDGASPDAFSAMHKGQVRIKSGAQFKDKIAYAFGAEFLEVRINRWTREIRVPRIVGAFAAGHIVNPRTARSQLMGGMIWGIASAIHEATEIDENVARYVNDNLADYLMPVNADIGQVDVILVPERDTNINPAGVKGLGELGNVGTPAAISNAVYHATGKRLRKLPIRLEDLLDIA